MKKTTRCTIGIFSVVFLSTTAAMAQRSDTLTEASYRRAAEVLSRGVEAVGGLKRFQTIEDISFKSSAQLPEKGQSIKPDGPVYVRRVDAEGVIDLRGKRSYRLSNTSFTGGAQFSISVVTTEKSGFTADLGANAVYPFAGPAVVSNNRAVQRTFPHLLLQNALNRASTLRSLGTVTYEGKKQDVITFGDSDGSQVTLFFAAQTGLLTKTEGLGDRFLEGLGALETIFTDYQTVGDIKIPFHVITKFGGELVSDLTYRDVKFDSHPGAALFDPPRGAEVGPEVGGSAPPISITKLAKDVYYVNAIGTGSIFFYSTMFVVFNDFVLVVEAPVNDSVSQSVIARIKETVPGKPIKYLVPTHYHVDHLGGIRGYIAEGATVVTTPGNRKLIESVASLVHPLNPDTLSLRPRQLNIETFTEKRVFSDGEHVVELYNLGPSPHADEILIAYLPQERIAFVSDLFPVTLKGKLGPTSPVFAFFNEKVRQMGLQIEIVASGHGRLGRMDELRRILESEKQSTSGR